MRYLLSWTYKAGLQVKPIFEAKATALVAFVLSRGTRHRSRPNFGHSQNHLAVAGGYEVQAVEFVGCAPTRYRDVVLTVSKPRYYSLT